jgi:cytochrome c
MRTGLVLLFLGFALTALTCPAAGADPERGRALFEDPALGGGTSGKTCLTCHEHGRDLSNAVQTGGHFTVMGIAMDGLEEVVNFCIEVTLRGEGLAPEGKDMADLIAYLKFFQARKTRVPDK